jgi:hypothetical protein
MVLFIESPKLGIAVDNQDRIGKLNRYAR